MRRISSPVAGMKAPYINSGDRVQRRHCQVQLLIVQHASRFGKGGRAIVIQMQENRRKKIVQFMARAAEVRCEPPALDSLVLPSSRKKKGFPSICATPSACWSNAARSEEHTSELQSLRHLVCRLLL